MRVVIAGGTGFIGAPLAERLAGAGHDVAVLTRRPESVRFGRALSWNPPSQGEWMSEVAPADVVINLAGENIGGGRWTKERKRRLIASRLDATGALVRAFRVQPTRDRVFISSSAIGYYGVRGDEVLTEEGQTGSGFLADLSRKWEAAAQGAEGMSRVVIPRFGIVLEKDGGALSKMLLPFRMGAGGPIGSGNQWMSWILRDDVLDAIEWAIGNASARGKYNLTAPEPVRNREFVKALGHALHRPSFMPAPALALKLLFGEMANEILLGGQKVAPARLLQEGFEFQARDIATAMSAIFGT